MRSDPQNTIWNAYRYIPLFMTMIVIFADTGSIPKLWCDRPPRLKVANDDGDTFVAERRLGPPHHLCYDSIMSCIISCITSHIIQYMIVSLSLNMYTPYITILTTNTPSVCVFCLSVDAHVISPRTRVCLKHDIRFEPLKQLSDHIPTQLSPSLVDVVF